MTRRGRKHHGGGHGLMQSAEKLGTLAAFIAPAAITLYEYRSTQDHGLKALVARYTPYDPDRGFNLGGMAYGWGPVVSFKLAAMAYHKIMGLLRRA